MKSNRFILFLLLFTLLSDCAPQERREVSETGPQIKQKQELGIEVSVVSSQLDLDQFQTKFFKINEIGRNKRSAYAKFIRKYDKFVAILTQNLYIPCKQAMIQSGIQMAFVGKKDQWEFSKQVALRINLKEINKLQKIIASFKLNPLKSDHSISEIEIKSKFIELFVAAKHKAQSISYNQYHGEMQVANLNVFHIESLKRYNQSCAEFQSTKFLMSLKFAQTQINSNVQCEGEQLVKQLIISFKFTLAKTSNLEIYSDFQQSQDQENLSSQEAQSQYARTY